MSLVSAYLQQALKLAMLAATLLPAWAVAADIEKWVDHSGRVHYGDRPPPWAVAKPVIVQHNVIETDAVVQPATSVARPTLRSRAKTKPQSTPLQRDEIRAYVELCRTNRGVDCEREARTMIDGPATILFPGDPLIFPRPDLRPPPPPPARPVPEKI